MKILFVQDSLGTGGAERSNAYLWYFLREKKILFKIVVLEQRTMGIEREILEAGFDVRFLKPDNFWKQASELVKVIKRYQPDIVHSVLFRAALRTRFARLMMPFFHVESLVNCTYDPIRFKDPKVNRYALWMYKQLDKRIQKEGTNRFIAITNEVKRHYSQKVKIAPNKIHVVYRGREDNPYLNNAIEVRSDVRKEFRLEDQELIFIHVGRQEFQKGHLILLKALKEVEHKLSSFHITFLFCGREGNATPAIKKFLKDNPLKINMQWLGHRLDVSRLLVGADAFISPSLYDGLGDALIEAQAAGLPAVCSDLKVFEEVVEKDVNALFFETGNEKALAGALMKLVEGEFLRQQMGKISLENFRSKFRLEGINQQMLDWYWGMRNGEG